MYVSFSLNIYLLCVLRWMFSQKSSNESAAENLVPIARENSKSIHMEQRIF